MVVAPAVVTLLGDRAWWLPRWLDRLLPNVSLEGRPEPGGRAGARSGPGLTPPAQGSSRILMAPSSFFWKIS
jgi:RND superfamily putative drug exporter